MTRFAAVAALVALDFLAGFASSALFAPRTTCNWINRANSTLGEVIAWADLVNARPCSTLSDEVRKPLGDQIEKFEKEICR